MSLNLCLQHSQYPVGLFLVVFLFDTIGFGTILLELLLVNLLLCWITFDFINMFTELGVRHDLSASICDEANTEFGRIFTEVGVVPWLADEAGDLNKGLRFVWLEFDLSIVLPCTETDVDFWGDELVLLLLPSLLKETI